MRSVADVDRLRSRRTVMDDSINLFEHRDVDCSSRSLASLLVAWVGAAMVASVLLRWKYMWIALTILTLIFLFACGYAACNARRMHDRAVARQEARIIENDRRTRNIQSVSESVDNHSESSEPPAYDTYWITDLPPPYAVVIGAEVPPISPSIPGRRNSPTASISTGTSLNPPPYSVAIQAERITYGNNESNSNTRQNSSQPRRTTVNQVGNSSLRRSDSEEPTNSRVETVVNPWDDEVAAWSRENDLKIANEQTRHQEADSSNSHVIQQQPSRGQYLSNILSCTFGRGQRRNNIAERNATTASPIAITGVAEPMDRDRPDITHLSIQDNGISESRITSSTL